MTRDPAALWSDRRVQIAATVLGALAIWIWRRPQQLTHPYVWDEESFILAKFLDHGWAAAFDLPQGYLTLPANVLVTLSAQLSWLHLPTLMYGFATAMFLLTVVLLVGVESRWGSRTVCAGMALAAALVPTNPEVFGVLLYSFWWSTLWPLIILGWKRDHWWIRAPALAVAALSSPAAGALFVVFGIAYFRSGRRFRDVASGGILFAGFVVQLALTVGSERGSSLSANASPGSVIGQILRTGGYYETTWLGHADHGFLAFAGLLFLATVAVAALAGARAESHEETLLLLAGALVLAAFSAVPAPLTSDPFDHGPRYFFLPYVGFAWVLLQLARRPPLPWVRTAAAIALCASLLGLASTFSRAPATTTAVLSWPTSLRACAASDRPTFAVPIYLDGSVRRLWRLRIAPARCRDMLG